MEPIIKVDNVSMCFNLSTEKHESLKEYLLAMVQGRLEDGVLTLWVKDEFTKSMVGGASILEELGRLASAQTGVPARCAVKVGKAPAAPAAAAPAQAAEHDKLDDLLAFSRQFDNIIIQE